MADSGTTRWWENYLVRYLMPSIAGVAIIGWLLAGPARELRGVLFLPTTGSSLDATSLTLLFLYGNLYCYIASYPVLVFHVTRVVDFDYMRWPRSPFSDGYIASLVVLAIAFFAYHCLTGEARFYGALAIAVGFAALQLRRLWKAALPSLTVPALEGTVSPSYAYAYHVACRRSSAGNGTEKVRTWHSEMIDTYRHMREHGNSAFIFLFELALASLVYCVVTKPGQTPIQQLNAIAILFALWAFPSVFVHLIGQQIERRFAKHDYRLRSRKRKSTNAAPTS